MLRNLGNEIETVWTNTSPYLQSPAWQYLRTARMCWSDYLDFRKHAPASRVAPLRYYETMEWLDKAITELE